MMHVFKKTVYDDRKLISEHTSWYAPDQLTISYEVTRGIPLYD